MENQPNNDNELNSLEDPGTVITGSSANSGPDNKPEKKKKGLKVRIQGLISHFNIYLLLFVLIVVLVAGFTFVSVQNNKKEAAPTDIQTQTLTPDALNKLNNSNTSVGDPKQTLSVESNAIFSGKVLIRDSLDVAGTIKIGGALSLPGLTVSGTSTFDQLQANKITSSGDANIQGQLTVQKGLTITGGASFGGPITAPQITVQSFQLSGDLQLQRHIDAGGGTPSKTDGGALGSGGTSSVSGTDTAGTITINTGSSPGVGCFITVSFAQKFNTTPHIVITPVGASAGGLSYYITRTNSSFSVCTTNPAPGGVSFGFDYIAID
jgi:cytoskeletal protein CcmA (bactofilin family)